MDANWLADEDGISQIRVSQATDGRGGFIPYTDRAIRWHTDGYYHPGERRIHGMILHCVRPALSGGVNALFDHEMAYLAMRASTGRAALRARLAELGMALESAAQRAVPMVRKASHNGAER